MPEKPAITDFIDEKSTSSPMTDENNASPANKPPRNAVIANPIAPSPIAPLGPPIAESPIMPPKTTKAS